MNIVFWNCQGLRPKRKELQNYLLENQIDILDRLIGTKGGVAILVKKVIIVNQEWKSEHFNVMRLLQLKSNSKMGIRLFWLPFTAQREILG